jgi:protein-arginine kinase activator protein McsA
MGQVIDFWSARPQVQAVESKKCCPRCGADLWHIRESGEVCCADCDEVCPLRLQMKNES